ncbi:hypothetical protein [Methanoplanus endosymbiosus]|uniref:Uncharacterized protein n=1 Tax=Methanoplanus endosymbiosus TaxID=33865 RepID=A0A9E7TJR7_9EURY|nr:hypothetical protein [Methanoplanus endosymbiosus]UUX92099.1 hypothetical protein L6E24_12155 [Methanoplanus endosymbiosus]
MASRTYPGRCLVSKNDTTKRKAKTEIIKALKADRAEEKKPQSWLVLFTGEGMPEYWIYLLVDRKATLKDIDKKLRAVWLECCGHLSSFKIAGRDYESFPEGAFLDVVESMETGVDGIFCDGLTGEHIYDYGSTTYLDFKVISKLPYRTKKGYDVEIVARNKMPEALCSVCGKEATIICLECLYEGSDSYLFCDECYEEHECDEGMQLPVVNSPRCGVCAYEGGLDDDMC